MIEAYVAGGTNGQRIVITLEELGLAYKLNKLSFDKNEHKSPAYLKLNPTGRIPTIVDTDAPGGPFVLTQTIAIMLYLAEKAQKLTGKTPAERARVYEWMMFQATDLSPGMGVAFFLAERMEPKLPQARPAIKDRINVLYKHMDDRLAANRFLAGDGFSLADILAWPMADTFEHDRFSGYAHIQRWRKDIAERPGVVRANTALA
ncbi:MAG: glutathione S-transferase family protein [Hyphomicrobiaceae bacterium]